MTLVQFNRRFGEIAVEKGFITHDQLDEALCTQKEMVLKGLDYRLISSVLYRCGHMTIEQAIEVATDLGIKSD